MEDNQIIELYWNRNEKAIAETDKKYGKYCDYIAYNILQDKEDSREILNDTYLKVWNSIPTERPNIFKLFLAKITRNLSIHKYKKNTAKKRNEYMEVVLEELEECLPSDNTIEKETEYEELVEHLNNFLKTIPTDKRKIFLDRYWNLSSIKDISSKNKMKESNVKVTLHRLRNELKDYLVKRGVVI